MVLSRLGGLFGGSDMLKRSRCLRFRPIVSERSVLKL